MRRWIVTATLAVAAATLAVTLTTPEPSEARIPAPSPVLDGGPPPLAAAEIDDGGLVTRASLDRSALLVGSERDRYLVVEVQAPETGAATRQPVQLAVVVDGSGSMDGEGKLINAKLATAALVERLGPQDSFSLVNFSGSARSIVKLQPVWDPTMLAARTQALTAQGSTNIYDGLHWGIQELSSGPAGNRRLVLISDGLATSGITDLDQIAGLAKRATTQGITVSALGLGVKFDGDLLYALSDAGGGSYLYAGRSAALAETIDAELERTFQVAAQSARVEVSFHPDVQLSQAYGYEAWDGEVTDNGFEAFLGDLHANQTRKVVLRVKPPTALAGELNLASIRVTWRDPESGETRTRTERVSLTLTQDNALVEASRVDWATVHASQASVGQSMQRANASWRAGNTEQATGILEQAQRKLARIRALVDAPALSQLDQGLSEQTQRYEQVELNSWEGLDLAAAESLRALGYVE